MERVFDITAERLEAAGLWRRASSRWMEVMLRAGLSDEQREWLRQRRKFCNHQVTSVVRLERFEVAEITRAATAAQIRMGISKPGGEAFRMKDKSDGRTPKLFYKAVIGDSDDDIINMYLKLADTDKNSQ